MDEEKVTRCRAGVDSTAAARYKDRNTVTIPDEFSGRSTSYAKRSRLSRSAAGGRSRNSPAARRHRIDRLLSEPGSAARKRKSSRTTRTAPATSLTFALLRD